MVDGLVKAGMSIKDFTMSVGDDGKIKKDELPPGRVTLYIGHMDMNDDHVIDAEEFTTFMKMFNNGKGFDSARNDGQ